VTLTPAAVVAALNLGSLERAMGLMEGESP